MLGTVCGSKMVAVIPLSDTQLEWVFTGTEVRLQCAERVSEVYKCKVEKVVPLEDISAVWRLMNLDGVSKNTSSVATKSSSSGSPSAQEAAFAAQVVLPEGVQYSIGARIDGVFIAPSQTIGSLCLRC